MCMLSPICITSYFNVKCSIKKMEWWTAQNASPTTKNYTYDVSLFEIVTDQPIPP